MCFVFADIQLVITFVVFGVNMEKQHLLEGRSTSWKYKITVEPTVLLYIAASTVSQNLQLNLLLDKACRVYNVEGNYSIRRNFAK